MFAGGQGVAQDNTEAKKWFSKAAEQGYAPAMASLGNMYETGQGVSQDYVQAYMWCSLAAPRFGEGLETLKTENLSSLTKLERELTP
jgi:TPR repeat protein